MPRRAIELGEAELETIRVLWDRGPSTVREIHEALAATKGTGYTTVLKQLQIMTDKELVSRDEQQRAHFYSASTPREQTERELVVDLLDRALDGSASKLVLHALESKRASREAHGCYFLFFRSNGLWAR